MTSLAEVILRLRPGSSFTLEGETLAGLRWLGDQPVTSVTEEECASMRALIAEERDAIAYRAKRAAEYPSVGDQLDDLFKQGAFSAEMTAKIQAVKDKYPKPA